METQNKTNEIKQETQKHYKWFLESCEKRKIKPISYKQFEKEFLEMKRQNETPEEKERLRLIQKAFNETLNLLVTPNKQELKKRSL
jgi:predicted HicB family RNase H-like nuclease